MAKQRARRKRPIPLEEALRQAVRSLRERRGWTQDDLAMLMRHQGLDWNRSMVKRFEEGRRRLELHEFFLLLAALRIGVEELFGPDHPDLELSEGWPVPASALPGFLAGTAVPSEEEAILGTAGWVASMERAQDARQAEEKAADALGITVPQVKALARRLWRRSLVRERERRLEKRAQGQELAAAYRKALRGHITRELLTEMRPRVRRSKR